MAVAISKPTAAGGQPLPRVDDVRSHRRRIRRFGFSGNYATGGYTVLATDVGMRRIIGVTPLGGNVVRAANGISGELAVIDYNADRTAFTIRLLEDAAGAAGSTIGVEKNNAEAHVASSFIDLEIIGY